MAATSSYTFLAPHPRAHQPGEGNRSRLLEEVPQRRILTSPCRFPPGLGLCCPNRHRCRRDCVGVGETRASATVERCTFTPLARRTPPRALRRPYCNRTATSPWQVIHVRTRASLRPPLSPDHPLVAPKGAGSSPRRSPCDMQVKRLRGSSTHESLRLIFKLNVDRRRIDEDRFLRQVCELVDS